jgi:alkanesulfonate monooxygenase SsuD/methylene tetrahydromethanopterin reductase-like flavin-dependent oxidoreductase (luciferase family)
MGRPDRPRNIVAKHDRQRRDGAVVDACDGFNILFPYLPAGFDDFVSGIVPEPQRRGIFRREV